MKLYVRPGLTMSWRTFTDQMSAHSIALDGFVPEGPRFNPSGPWANFNHHEGVSRLETRATCAQVLITLRQGLMQAFDSKRMRVYVNDCDEDVCLSVFILRNPKVTMPLTNPLLNRLVFMEDVFDTTGGGYAFDPTLDSLHELLWIFEPYHLFRASGTIYEQDAKAYRKVISRVGERITAYLNGAAGRVTPDIRYRLLLRGHGFVMVHEIGRNARLGIYADNNNAFIAVNRMPKGSFSYTLARSSLFVPFPIPKLLKALNEAERDETCNPFRASWGGSDIIAGSPRGLGSVLPPMKVFEIVQETLVS